MRLHLLAAFVLAPSLVACASSTLVSPTASTPLALDPAPPTPTTVFLETAGMELTSPSGCDYVAAIAALGDVVSGEPEAVRPACEAACRIDTCRNIAIQAEVMGAMYYDEFDDALPQLVAHCEQATDSCVAVTGVVMRSESLDTLGLDLPIAEEEDEEDELAERFEQALAPDPANEAACQNGDAAACYALVDLDAVLTGWEMWQTPIREASLQRWQQACDLEPMVYCLGLEIAIEYTTDTGCSG
jgi:hypothetical protein